MKLSEMSCSLCKRSNLPRKDNQPPQMQRAHVFANRLTGREKRYKGARNTFTDAEWKALIKRLGKEFDLRDHLPLSEAKRTLSNVWFPMCAECHQEVLAEPFYLPSFLEALSPHFVEKSRIEKMLTLMSVLQLGLKEFNKTAHGS